MPIRSLVCKNKNLLFLVEQQMNAFNTGNSTKKEKRNNKLFLGLELPLCSFVDFAIFSGRIKENPRLSLIIQQSNTDVCKTNF